jgi:glycosyltransferase involved in cell wall biosynthesis
MVCPQYRPLVGGYERAAERLAGALHARGCEVEVVAERRDPAWPAFEDVDGVPLHRVWSLFRPGIHTITSVLGLAGFLLRRGRRFDVLHVHQYGWPAAVSIAFGRATKRPVVLKLTATGVDGIHHTVGGMGARGRLLAGLHRRVDACLATSDRGAEEAAKFGIPRERLYLVPNGIDTALFRPLPAEERETLRKQLGVAGKIVVLYVGRLSPEKNPLGLLEAWARLGPPQDAVLALAGEGPERGAVAARAAQLGDAVRVLGPVLDPLAWYQAADLFVLASVSEGLSNALLEALACGLPVVSTPVSGSEDIFATANVGTLVPGPDPASLAGGIASLLGDASLRASCGEAARRVAVQRYSLESVAERIESIYREITSGEAILPPFSNA